MVVQYEVFGRKVGSHVLAMLTLGTTAAIGTFALAGKKVEKTKGPPINATSKDEEDFIQQFIRNANTEEQKAKH